MLFYGHTPMQVLVELRNSPFFRSTSRSKSNFLLDSRGMGFSGKQALLRAPDFEENKIQFNYKKLEKFTTNYTGIRVHNRATMYEDIGVNDLIKFFKSLKCREDAPKHHSQYMPTTWLSGMRDFRMGKRNSFLH